VTGGWRQGLGKGAPAALLAAIALPLSVFASVATADVSVCPPGSGAGQCGFSAGLAVDAGLPGGAIYDADYANNRVDVFDGAGSFRFAFGWGVVDGAAALQRCGPQAVPPSGCRAGLQGGGAGEFNNIGGIAVDSDATSPSQHDVYVLDGHRVQKFSPEGEFLLALGGGVISGGAVGSGNLALKSNVISAVQTSKKRFEVGQTISGTGIPTETKITRLEAGTITLSKAVTAAGAGVALSVAEGPGNVPVNEIDVLVNRGGPPSLTFSTPEPDSANKFEAGLELPEGASGPELQEALEALPNIGPGNVAVTGVKVNGADHEYTIEFKGPRFADTDVSLEKGAGAGVKEVLTLQNGASGAGVCPAASAASCAGGVETGELGGPGRFGRFPQIAVGPGGTVYVADCVRVRAGIDTECKDRLQKFSPAGAFGEEISLPQSPRAPSGLAVDASGAFYLSASDGLRKYDAAGNLLGEATAGSVVGALALDGAGNLFAAESEKGGERPVIAEYDSSLATLRRFGYDLLKSQPTGLAPFKDAGGDIYSAEVAELFHRFLPDPGPIVVPRPCAAGPLGNTNATLRAEVNPEGKATKFHFEYVSKKHFDEEGFANASKTPESALVGDDLFLHDALFRVEGLQAETEYRCRVVASNADDPEVLGVEGNFKTEEPFKFGAAWTTAVKAETATVNVEGNPLGIPTKGQIEYVDDAGYQAEGFEKAQSAPAGEFDFGSSETTQLRSVVLTGLTPGTLYHYRLRARNGNPPEGIICPEAKEVACPELEHTLTTYRAGTGSGDSRGFELVSPAAKNSAEVVVPGQAGGFFEPSRTIRIQAGAGSGEAITYTSFTSFANPESAPATSQYLSRRTQDGWTTENISPFGHQAFPLVPPYNGFSADLGNGAFKVRSPALTPDCPEEYENFYLRLNGDGAIHCLTPEAPNLQQGNKVCFNYAGASEDGTRAFFASDASYAGALDGFGSGYNLYEWSEGKLKLVSVLPASQGGGVAAPTAGTSFGPVGSASFLGNCQFGQTILRHAISADGSRAIWTYLPSAGPSQLLVRVNGSETIQLDKKEEKSKTSGGGVFWAASADGTVVYFTDANRLIPGKSEPGAPDLYRSESGVLSNLTPKSIANTAANVRGVVGASDDGAYVYFVAKGALSEEANKDGEKAIEGEDNLYLNHAGDTSFIATLSPEDEGDWESQPQGMSARVSPDGRHLAFISVNSPALAGYDNTVAAGGHCRYQRSESEFVGSPICPQAFLYDADTEELTCASCNPAGSRPLGPTFLPGWSNVYEGPRYLSDDGSRLFFESFDALSPADESPRRDVYEFERSGSGSCRDSSPNFDPKSDGCHFLISSGKSSDETYLVDAASSGRDVFLSTRAVLVGWDTNENYDVYDAREGGGFAEPPPAPLVCEGEGCLAPVPPPPSPSAPATPSFVGPGNAVPKHKKKHKSHKKKGAQKKKGAKKHGKAQKKGKGGR
jgi:hypothetical protein